MKLHQFENASLFYTIEHPKMQDGALPQTEYLVFNRSPLVPQHTLQNKIEAIDY